jgi:hypothetical protein
MQILRGQHLIQVIASLSGNVRKEWSFKDANEIVEKVKHYRRLLDTYLERDRGYIHEEINILSQVLKDEFGLNSDYR